MTKRFAAAGQTGALLRDLLFFNIGKLPIFLSTVRQVSARKERPGKRCLSASMESAMGDLLSVSRPLGTAMVGGALAMAILDLLVRKKLLTVDDVQGALKTAQGSLISSPAVSGSLDGARIIGEISEQIMIRDPDKWSGYRG